MQTVEELRRMVIEEVSLPTIPTPMILLWTELFKRIKTELPKPIFDTEGRRWRRFTESSLPFFHWFALPPVSVLFDNYGKPISLQPLTVVNKK